MPEGKEPKKVLIIDEESLSVQEVGAYLGKHGYDILTANDGLTGLKLARLENPALVIVDGVLPTVSGYQLTRLLKFDERYKHIPIAFTSHKNSDTEEILVTNLGADLFLTKPIELDGLLEMLEDIMAPDEEESV